MASLLFINSKSKYTFSLAYYNIGKNSVSATVSNVCKPMDDFYSVSFSNTYG